MVNFKTYDITDWTANNGNTHIAQYFKRKENQAMKIGQLMKYSLRNIFLQKSCRKWGRRPIPDLFLCFKKSFRWGKRKSSAPYFYIYFGRPQLRHTIKTNFRTFQTVDPEICSILILCKIFSEKYFSCYILLTDQISLSFCIYFLRYWAICVL